MTEPAEPITVTLVHSSAPRTWEEETITVPAGTTVAEALTIAGWKERFRLVNHPELSFGIWGRVCQLGTELTDGDRVEVVRNLRVDPKVARRERFQKQGAKAAGLFSSRRPGSKPGY